MTESWDELKDKAYGQMNCQKSKWFNYKMLLLTGGGIFVDGYNIVIISFGLAGIVKLFGLQHQAFLVGLIGISVIIGNLVGALFSGYFVDRLGRRLIFIIDQFCLFCLP